MLSLFLSSSPLAFREFWLKQNRASRGQHLLAQYNKYFAAMPLVSEMVHPRSMDFGNQRKVVILRDQGHKWSDICTRVVNLKGEHPSEWQCRDLYKSFNRQLGRRKFKYANCGRKVWKVSADVKTFLVRRLLALRRSGVCTSTTLQRDLLQEKNVQLSCSAIRKVLQLSGYKWLPRSQKPKYCTELRAKRLQFARDVLAMSQRELNKYLAMAMDGVVLSLPPADAVDRANYCHIGESHMWRKPGEAAKPELAGADPYAKQIPYARAVPMWGGIGPGGFGLVMFHKWKKVDQEEWSAAVDSGNLVAACKSARPDRQHGPWHILCDNESFLEAPASRTAHRRVGVHLWHIPPRSPDLNPVERFWSWVRRRLRAMDLADMKAKRSPVQKTALKARVRALLRTVKARTVAKNIFQSLHKTCREVVKKKGAATR